MIKNIALREGIGDLLAEGTKRAAEKIGRGSARYAMHVKGLEIPAMGIRAMERVSSSYAYGIPYVTDGGGARHEAGSKREEQFSMAIVDSLSLCCHIFPWLTYHKFFPLFVRLLNLITELDFTSEELFTIGERIWNLERCIAVREGITRKEDTLPQRFYSEPLPSGMAEGAIVKKEKFEKALDTYYAKRGWDKKTGIPTEKKLHELALDDVISTLEL
jgi:aldehyde:ferredoxin oxidoreductase